MRNRRKRHQALAHGFDMLVGLDAEKHDMPDQPSLLNSAGVF
jgi:hypothetical protein